MKPRSIDDKHCEVDDYSREPYYSPCWGTAVLVRHKIKAKCDWEYNPMFGGYECNTCGMIRG